MSLLFRLSGKNPAKPEVANGNSSPNFLRDVDSIHDDRFGSVLRCKPTQLLAYWAPGNIYAERGSLSFFWRSREELGETEFPLFRVSFADHSSWDALFIRIDYNGSGIDAFVTDINLSRLRISYSFPAIPDKDDWTHILFSWDENSGVTLYINGEKAGEIKQKALLYSALDQFGTHSRIISNAQVQSSYNYMRTGDFAEIRIYDRAVTDKEAKAIAENRDIDVPSIPDRTLSEIKDEWFDRYGFDEDAKPYFLSQRMNIIRKVEIHDAWDHKRWWWKANDGIRETTWPGVYNRSRLPGRLDYFVLPDWDCYSLSGKKIKFVPLRDEEFNNVQISGSAAGHMSFTGVGDETVLDVRRESSERSSLNLNEPFRNIDITFENDQIEEPIGDFSLFNIHPGAIEGEKREDFYFSENASGEDYSAMIGFINKRMLPDEAFTLYGCSDPVKVKTAPSLPVVNLLAKYRTGTEWGMDGVEITIPHVSSSSGEVFYNVQIKDPLWQYRVLMNVNFSVLGDKEKVIFFDTRDRILPVGGTLYVTIAASADMSSEFLSGLKLSIVYKNREEAKKEHIADRFIQVKDNYANLVEENPSNEHFNMFNRFKGDLLDLLAVDPDNRLAQEYYFDKFKENAPEFKLSRCPEGVPDWAWRQTEYMNYVKRFLRWWIDKRQVSNGEFGGGLSDDGDLTAWWPGPAIAGCMPDKISESLRREMEAFYDQGMFANGLCAIQTDQLHTLEDGIQALGQCLTLFPTDPLYIERAMENVKGAEFVTGYTDNGHRHVLSGYYSGTRIAMEKPWRYSASDSFHILHPTYMLARYNGSPEAKKLILELADSMLEHYYDGRLHVLVDTVTEEDQVHERTREWHLFYCAYDLTGDKKYLKPISDEWYKRQQDRLPESEADAFDYTARKYEALIKQADLRQYINTDAQLWVDRCVIDVGPIQEDRCGGVAHVRFALYPRNNIRWTFISGSECDVAILVRYGEKDKVELVAYNLSDSPVKARMDYDGLINGEWVLKHDGIEKMIHVNRFEKGEVISFEPGYNRISLNLVKKEENKRKADLAMSAGDIIIRDDCVRVMVHNIGGAESAYVRISLLDENGIEIRHNFIPPLPAPDDLYPKKMEIPLWTRGIDLSKCSIVIDKDRVGDEMTRENNCVFLSEVL